jgi:hypothetical protein
MTGSTLAIFTAVLATALSTRLTRERPGIATLRSGLTAIASAAFAALYGLQ